MAIPAHFARPTKAQQEREPRRKLLLDAQGTPASGEATAVLVHNISASGMLIECAPGPLPGETIEIDLPDAGPTAARIVWTSGRLCGCRFDAPVSNATLSAARLRSAVSAVIDVELAQAAVPDEPLGSRIGRLRKARGLTLAQLANRLDVSKPTVWAWEKGRARPLDDRLDALAGALGVRREDLLSTRDDAALQELVARCRDELARACGASPDKVRIFIEV
jgi:transcriptional regulator with XRE-family HTH domain